ncbi:uncharacterized protein TrAFT101_007204 [Trichoderma asperellum]|uniref:uncharacterized protein n=1 Tax=Trichoderma asperellum TaxID=101201 RepID=UPI00331AA66B|nr:hypothetical protein TrAFT101_007204 [Trichoderma asperellum]
MKRESSTQHGVVTWLPPVQVGMHTQRSWPCRKMRPRMSGHVTPHPIVSLAAPTPSWPESLTIYHAFVPHSSGSKVTLAPRFTIVPAPPLREFELVARVPSTLPIPQK